MTFRKTVALSAATGALVLLFGAMVRAWFRLPTLLDAILADLEFRLFLERFSEPTQASTSRIDLVGMFVLSALLGALCGAAAGLVFAKWTNRLWPSVLAAALLCLLLQLALGGRVTT